MKTVSTNNRLRQLVRATTVALVAGAPLIGTVGTAEAQRGDYDSGRDWGYGRDPEWYQERYPGGRIRQDITITGVVSSDLPGDQFDVRADNGRIYRVVFHRNDNEPRRLSRGDRVSIDGHLDRDILIAHDVRILDNRGSGGWGQYNRVTREGVVTRDLSGDEFEMRTDGWRLVRVRAHGDEPRRLSRGDRVTVYGRFSSSREDLFIAESVRILDNHSSGSWGQYGRVAREGVVTRDYSGDEFAMRADNGRVFRVRARGDEPRRLSRGDLVTVCGRFSDSREDLFIAENVRITRNR